MRGFSLVIASLMFAAPAFADDKSVCIDASERAQQLRDDQKLLDARRELIACGHAACPAPIVKDCAELLADVERRLPSIVVRVKGAGGEDVTDATALVDGRAASYSAPISLDPGAHTLRVQLRNARVLEESLVLVQGQHERLVSVDFGTSEAPRGGAQRTIGLVIAGSGLAGVVLGSIFGVLAISNKDTQVADCASSASCPNALGAAAAHDNAVTMGTASTVAFIAGGALVVLGGVLFFTAPRSKVRVGTTGLGVALVTSF